MIQYTLAVLLGSVFYTLVGVRCGIILYRVGQQVQLSSVLPAAILIGILWPACAFLYGLCVFLSGDTGMFADYDNQER